MYIYMQLLLSVFSRLIDVDSMKRLQAALTIH